MVLESKSVEQTLEFGRRVAQNLIPGKVVGFYGELGSGKTTMIKGIAQGLGIKELVKSPSFVMITEYQGRYKIYHIDLYRITSVKELETIGFNDYLDTDGISLIEWAEKAETLLPKTTLRIRLSIVDEATRIIEIQNGTIS